MLNKRLECVAQQQQALGGNNNNIAGESASPNAQNVKEKIEIFQKMQNELMSHETMNGNSE